MSKLVSDPIKLKKYIRKPTCKRFEIINSDLVMILMTKQKLLMNKPIYAGNGYIRYSKNGSIPISLPLHDVEVFSRSMSVSYTHLTLPTILRV